MTTVQTREAHIAPKGLTTETYPLSPADIYGFSDETYLTWPFLFDYDLDADTLIKALETLSLVYPHLCGRICRHPDVRYLVKVTPDDDANYGFPFVEQKSNLSLAEAILNHGQIQMPSANYPVWPEVPFFMEKIDTKALVKGETPLTRVKLTHFKDGCAVNITISHILADGQRCIELYRDLSRAYRGLEVAPRDHDRNRLWPDRVAQRYPFLGKAVANLPRKVAAEKESVEFVTHPEEAAYLEAFYFPKDVLEGMKSVAAPLIPEGAFVSTNDLLTSFVWMLMSEIGDDRGSVAKGADLDISLTLAGLTVEYCMNGIDIVPENYFGNGFVGLLCSNHELDIAEAPLHKVFAEHALLVRNNLLALKTVPQVAAQYVLAYYFIVHEGKFPTTFERYRASVTNLTKTPVNEVDFGKGPPKMAHIITPLPLVGVMGSAVQGFGEGGGLMLHLQLSEKQRARLKTSCVIKECAPGVKRLFSDFTVAELATLMHS